MLPESIEAPPPPPIAAPPPPVQAPPPVPATPLAPPDPPKLSCTALYEFKSTHAENLDMVKGEQFTVLEKDINEGWTLVKNANEKEGKVPTSYVKIGE